MPEPLFNKSAGLGKICETFRNAFFIEHFLWLLLPINGIYSNVLTRSFFPEAVIQRSSE